MHVHSFLQYINNFYFFSNSRIQLRINDPTDLLSIPLIHDLPKSLPQAPVKILFLSYNIIDSPVQG